MINSVIKGEAIATDWTGTIKTGSVEISETNAAVAAFGTDEKLAEVRTALLENSLKVFDTDTFTVGGEKLESYLADVYDTGDSVPDTEVIFGGYFHESEMRSSPYFDINIDGITLLNN